MGDLYRHEQRSGRDAVLELVPETEGATDIDPRLYGKFAEHLSWNVSKGMSAQLLTNPTFGRWRFIRVIASVYRVDRTTACGRSRNDLQ
jgi:hypothetical protein